jgi:hypothetical protein
MLTDVSLLIDVGLVAKKRINKEKILKKVEKGKKDKKKEHSGRVSVYQIPTFFFSLLSHVCSAGDIGKNWGKGRKCDA